MVNREPSFVPSWTGEQLDMPARGLLSRVMGVAAWSRTAFPPAEVSLEREAALPVSTQSVRPSWVIDECVCDILGRNDMVSTPVAGHEFAFHMLWTVLFRGVSTGVARANCSGAPNEFLMLEVTGQVLLQTVRYTPVLEIPSWLRSWVTGTVRKASLMLENSSFVN